MKRLAIALVLVASQAQALEWPWSDGDTASDDNCMGFVGAGLADSRVAGWSRTQLWLAWNDFTRDGLGDLTVFQQLYQSGSDRYDTVTPSADGDLLSIADGACGLPRQ
jgi:hypothetical protein